MDFSGMWIATATLRVSLIALVFTPGLPPAVAFPIVYDHTPPRGFLGMSDSAQRALLVAYYEALLANQDVEAFQNKVQARYTEATLCRLIQSSDMAARRASVLALGLMGTMQCNASVASALQDADPSIRDLAAKALWAIWFRGDSREQAGTLERVASLVTRGKFDEAEELATRLIDEAPDFAEAYNQRAIALFSQGRYSDSAADCRRTLERNPYHFGALGGLGQCYIRMGERTAALETFRRALELQPHDAGLKQTIEVLEAESS